jgi:hypothetical protein
MPRRYTGGFLSATEQATDANTANGIFTVQEAGALTTAGNFPTGRWTPQRSLRVRSAASAYLNRTPAAAGNRQIFTYSVWVKLGPVGTSMYLISANTASGFNDGFGISTSSGQLALSATSGGSTVADVITSAYFRDPSAWYHFVIAVNTTEAVSSNRIKIYINGVQATISGTFPSQNSSLQMNNTGAHYIGRLGYTSSVMWDGYMSEINSIDGQALDPSYFGATDPETGTWVPKRYTGTYGTNGFYLPFNDNTTTYSLGKNASGFNNLLSYTEQLDNAYWTKSATTVSANSVANPLDGATNADTVLESATTAAHYIQNASAVTKLANGTYSFSVYAKAAGQTTIALQLSESGGGYMGSVFDLSAGSAYVYTAIGMSPADGTNHQTITPVGNGWYRCSVNVTTGSPTNITAKVSLGGYDASYAGNASNGVYLWGMQINAGSVPLQYASVTSSPVSNDWTPSNFSLTAGTTYDSMVDVPGIAAVSAQNDVGGVVRGNYPTFNPLSNASNTLSNGNLTITGSGATYKATSTTMALPSTGKFYWEFKTGTTGDVLFAGIGAASYVTQGSALTNNTSNETNIPTAGIYSNTSSGKKVYVHSGSGTGVTSTDGDLWMFAYEADTGKFYNGINGVWYSAPGGVTTAGGSNPAIGAGWLNSILPKPGDALIPYAFTYNTTGGTYNFGQTPFTYTPPSGFRSLCTSTLTTPVIKRPSDHFNIKLWTGNGKSQQIGAISKETSGYQINKSLRLRAINATYLNRTPAAAGNRRTWTWSCWFKSGTSAADSSAFRSIVEAFTGSNDTYCAIATQNQSIYLTQDNGSGGVMTVSTVPLYRDASSWYHLVVAVDTTQAIGVNRVKMYINGIQQSLTFGITPSQNLDTWMNSANPHRIGGRWNLASTTSFWDGHLAEVNLIDGQQLTPSSFGIFDANNNWMPQRYRGTYGTNGFYLNFNDNSGVTAATIGADTSGNSNNWTPNNLNVVANEYTTSQTWVAPAGVTSVDYLVVGGGGGGGGAVRSAYSAGGGGGGGRVLSGTLSVTPGSPYTITIGTGGTAGSYGGGAGGAGGSSVFASVTSAGGSGGAAGSSYGGSGGASGGGLFGGGSAGQGFGGGGGGAGGTGGSYNGASGVGGAAVTSSISTFSVGYGGGGSGAVYAGIGGTGAPGAGGGYGSYPGQAGTANRGGGGGGGGDNTVTGYGGGAGGSGVVWLKWTGTSAAYSTTDTPTDTVDSSGNVVGNYAVLDPNFNIGSATISNSNLTISSDTSGAHKIVPATLPVSSGKWYFEMILDAGTPSNAYAAMGLIPYPTPSNSYYTNLPSSASGTNGFSWQTGTANTLTLWIDYDSTYRYVTINPITASANGDVMQIALDIDNNKIWVGRNNTWYDASGGSTGNPSTGANPTAINVSRYISEYGALVPFCSTGQSNTVTANFGQTAFAYTPPTGFKSINTKNLKDVGSYNLPDTWGNFVNTPDFIWLKNRTTTANDAAIYDTVRGPQADIRTGSTQANTIYSGYGVQNFTPNGFSVAGNGTISNSSGDRFVAWCWNRGKIPGFDIVNYAGSGSTVSQTIAHNLGVAPKFMLAKVLNTTNGWLVYHASLGATKSGVLNGTNAFTTQSDWNSTEPTSNTFSVYGANNNTVNNSYIAYLWAEVPGFSKFGSYTGNASTDGPVIYTGFRPKWIMVKRTDSVSGADWVTQDTVRNTYNPTGATAISANDYRLEIFGLNCDILSNGFKIRTTDTSCNASAAAYAYIAFAEAPFKYANAR